MCTYHLFPPTLLQIIEYTHTYVCVIPSISHPHSCKHWNARAHTNTRNFHLFPLTFTQTTPTGSCSELQKHASDLDFKCGEQDHCCNRLWRAWGVFGQGVGLVCVCVCVCVSVCVNVGVVFVCVLGVDVGVLEWGAESVCFA
jgi:hypothetical protein